MFRHVDRYLNQYFVVAAMCLASCGLANADEALEIAAKHLVPTHDYRLRGSSYAVYLSSNQTRLGSDDLITLDVGIECLSGGTYEPLTNPFLERDLPTCLVISVFDSEGRFVGSVPEFDEPGTEREKWGRLAKKIQTDLHSNEVAGTSVCLSTGPVSAACGSSNTMFLETPGTYTVQAVCAKRMFELPPLTDPGADKRLAWTIEQRRKELASEACSSATVTVVVGDHAQERQTSNPISVDPVPPTACRLELVGSTNDGEALVMLRQTNTGHTDLYLHEPVMRIVGDGLSPVRLWLKNSDGVLMQDLSYARAGWQYGSPHPIVRLPSGGFVCKKHKVPNRWNRLDRTLQAVYSEDLFKTKSYAEYRRDSKRPPEGISSEDYSQLLLKDRPQYLIKSNVLELPAADVGGSR